MQTMKGGSECICDIDRIIEYMRGSCKNCTLEKRRQGDTRNIQADSTMKSNRPSKSSRRDLASLTHEEVLVWLRNEKVSVYARQFERLNLSPWYLEPPVSGQTLVDVCMSDNCKSLTSNDSDTFTVRTDDKHFATGLQRKKFVRVLSLALQDGISIEKLKKRK